MATRPRLVVVYDSGAVKPGHAAKLLLALRSQFGRGATITAVYLTHAGKKLVSAKGANRARIVVEVPA